MPLHTSAIYLQLHGAKEIPQIDSLEGTAKERLLQYPLRRLHLLSQIPGQFLQSMRHFPILSLGLFWDSASGGDDFRP